LLASGNLANLVAAQFRDGSLIVTMTQRPTFFCVC